MRDRRGGNGALSLVRGRLCLNIGLHNRRGLERRRRFLAFLGAGRWFRISLTGALYLGLMAPHAGHGVRVGRSVTPDFSQNAAGARLLVTRGQ